MKNYDIALIGSGPAGYVAALVAAQKGKSVALIEKKQLGGTCLNRGCIPTKALIAGSDVWKMIQDSNRWGIEVKEASFDYSKMHTRKNQIIDKLQKGIKALINSRKIDLYEGHAKFEDEHVLKILSNSPQFISANKIFIATGSEPRNLPGFDIDGLYIHNSTTILEMTHLPKSITILGGGYIGCEFASLFNQLGVNVTLCEAANEILPTECPEIIEQFKHVLKTKGIQLLTNCILTSSKIQNEKVHLQGTHQGKPINLTSDKVLVAIGRSLNTDQINLEKTGVAVTDKGTIWVNEHMQTTCSHIYAIGDVNGQSLLAHAASHQAHVAVEHACGNLSSKVDTKYVPSVIFTHPEIASVGLTYEKAKKLGYDVKTGVFPFENLSKALAVGYSDGFAQVVIEKNTLKILGAQVIGYQAGNLIAEITLAMQHEITADAFTQTIHAHPTMSEVWPEAFLTAMGIPLHSKG